MENVKRAKKRILALLLVFAMVLSSFSFAMELPKNYLKIGDKVIDLSYAMKNKEAFNKVLEQYLAKYGSDFSKLQIFINEELSDVYGEKLSEEDSRIVLQEIETIINTENPEGKIALHNYDGKLTIENDYLEIGNSIKITVEDKDLNIDPEVKDSAFVFCNKTDENIELIETENNSGIFETEVKISEEGICAGNCQYVDFSYIDAKNFDDKTEEIKIKKLAVSDIEKFKQAISKINKGEGTVECFNCLNFKFVNEENIEKINELVSNEDLEYFQIKEKINEYLDSLEVSEMEVKVEPKVEYNEGETLKLQDLIIEIVHNDGIIEEISYTEFEERGIEINLKDGEKVSLDNSTLLIKHIDSGKELTIELHLHGATIPESITLNQNSLTLTRGNRASLVATILPEEAQGTEVVWSSSNEEVATVEDGKITTYKAGKAIIKVQTKINSLEATCMLTVLNPVTPPPVSNINVTGVSLNKDEITLLAGGEKSTLEATIAPNNATNKNITWTSTDEDVATVVNGEITPIGAGTATIKVITQDGNKEATCEVTVINNALVSTKDEFEKAIESTKVTNITLKNDIEGNVTVNREGNTDFTIDFKTYKLTGNLNFTASLVENIILDGDGINIDGDLIVSAENGTVTNNLDITGNVTIEAISDHTWNQNGDAEEIGITADGGAFNLQGGTIPSGISLSPISNERPLQLHGDLSNIPLVVKKPAKVELKKDATPPKLTTVEEEAEGSDFENETDEDAPIEAKAEVSVAGKVENKGEEGNLKQRQSKPAFSVTESSVCVGDKIEITADGAEHIYYTLDESEPTKESTEYTEAITITEKTVIKAIAICDGKDDSHISIAKYDIKASTASFVAINSFGIHADKVYAGYKLVDNNNEQIKLIGSNIVKMTVLEPGASVEKELTVEGESDPMLWMNVEKAKGDYKYSIITKGNIEYKATLKLEEPIEASFIRTGREGEHEGITYVEFEMNDGSNKISLKEGEVKLIANKKESKWVELEANSDATLWFNKAHEDGITEYIVVSSDNKVYKAELNWLTVDVSLIDNSIKLANLTKQDVQISEDGTDVLVGTNWVTQDANDALDAAIEVATNAKDTVKTAEDVDAAVDTLDTAIETYNNAKADGTKAKDIEVSAINVTPTTLTLTVGAKGRLTANVEPADATDKSINWNSLDGATVETGDGYADISCDTPGTYSIKVESISNPEVSQTVTVTVQPSVATYAVTFADTNSVNLSGATIVVKDSENADVTDLSKVANGTYSYTITLAGYDELTGNFTVEDGAKEVSVTLVAETPATPVAVDKMAITGTTIEGVTTTFEEGKVNVLINGNIDWAPVFAAQHPNAELGGEEQYAYIGIQVIRPDDGYSHVLINNGTEDVIAEIGKHDATTSDGRFYYFAVAKATKEGETTTYEVLTDTEAKTRTVKWYSDASTFAKAEKFDVIREALDTSAIDTAITAANAAKVGVVISADGKDVAVGTDWVTQAVNDALVAAITTATSAKSTVTTAQQVTDAAAALDNAVGTYNAAKADGTKVKVTSVTITKNPTEGNKVGDVVTISDVMVNGEQPGSYEIEYFAAVQESDSSTSAIGNIVLADKTSNQITIPAEFELNTGGTQSIVGKYIDFGAKVKDVNGSGRAESIGPIEGSGVSKSALTDAIAAANTKHDNAVEGTKAGQYAVGSKATYKTAIDAAQAVADKAGATQEEVNQAVTDLATATAAFEAGKVAEVAVDPVVNEAVSATAVNVGQTLADSTLSGTFKVSAEDGTEVAGSLAWTDDTTVVNATGDFGWTFTPADTDSYNVVTGNVSVTANEIVKSTVVRTSTGGTEATFNKETLTFSGKIDYYLKSCSSENNPPSDGNYVGVRITAGDGVTVDADKATFKYNNQAGEETTLTSTWLDGDNYVDYYPKVTAERRTFTVVIDWDGEGETYAPETFEIKIANDAELKEPTDAQKVEVAKLAVVNGTVTVATGADATVKLAAVQTYIDKLIDNGVNAVVKANEIIAGDYDVALSLNEASDTKTITMTINEEDTDTQIVDAEIAKYETTVTIVKTVEAGTNVTETVKKLAVDKIANEDVTVSVTAVGGDALLKLSGESVTLVKQLVNQATDNETTVTLTFTKGKITKTAEVTVTIEKQDPIKVTKITLSGQSGGSVIATKDGTLQINATISPENATDKTVTWSVEAGTGTASISDGGVLTALTDGTVTVKATANDASGVSGEMKVTISGQNEEQEAPTGLVGVAPTTVDDNDGKITGVTTAMEYKLSTDTDYVAVTGTEITGLAARTYNVRYAAKEGYNAGAIVEVTVDAYVAPTYALSFVAASGAESLTDATIKVYSDSERKTEITDYSAVEAGTYYYTIRKANFGFKEASVEITDADKKVEITLVEATNAQVVTGADTQLTDVTPKIDVNGEVTVDLNTSTLEKLSEDASKQKYPGFDGSQTTCPVWLGLKVEAPEGTVKTVLWNENENAQDYYGSNGVFYVTAGEKTTTNGEASKTQADYTKFVAPENDLVTNYTFTFMKENGEILEVQKLEVTLKTLEVPATLDNVSIVKVAADKVSVENAKANQNAITVTGNLADGYIAKANVTLKSYDSSNTTQGSGNWVGFIVDTGLENIIGLSVDTGSGTFYDFVDADVTEATGVGAEAGEFVFWMKADVQAERTLILKNGEETKTFTIKVVVYEEARALKNTDFEGDTAWASKTADVAWNEINQGLTVVSEDGTITISGKLESTKVYDLTADNDTELKGFGKISNYYKEGLESKRVTLVSFKVGTADPHTIILGDATTQTTETFNGVEYTINFSSLEWPTL